MIRQRFTTHSLLKEAGSLGIGLVCSPSIEHYLDQHPDLLRMVSQMVKDARRALPDAAMRLELVGNPDEIGAKTLMLYLHPRQVDSTLFEQLKAWNDRIAQALRYSEGWFLVSTDLPSQRQ